MAIALEINGKTVSVNAPPDTPLLWVLRDELQLTGTKYGCGIGKCGACTVLIEGEARRSCGLSVGQLEGRRVTTIEGMKGGIMAALQAAWAEIDVPQCGYCQSGQLMSAAALLAANPRPSDADIDQAMDHNLCRCGTYQRIRVGIHLAATKLVGARP